MDRLKRLLGAHTDLAVQLSIGLLVLRLGSGLTMALAHGLGKFGKLVGPEPIQFADPFGLGQPVSLALATFGELGCGLLIAIGLATRFAVLPFAFTMSVAILHAHRADPWNVKEHAFLFLVPALAILFLGPGRFSLDRILFGPRG